jgi:phospholipase C
MQSNVLRRLRDGAVVSAAIYSLISGQMAFAQPEPVKAAGATKTPIKHVIIIIGENRTFDHVFATYKPVKATEKVLNLLSEGIVNADGTPGPNYARSKQSAGSSYDEFQLAPQKSPYTVLPPAMVGGPSVPYVCQALSVTTGTSCDSPQNEAAVANVENGLSSDYVKYALTGGTGQSSGQPDARISYDGQNASNLPPGVFQITNATSLPYDAYTASPVHRLFQMWQQLDCSASAISKTYPTGCLHDLFPWVETSVGAGSNGAAQPVGFTNETTNEGSTSMGFYNVQAGDAPYLKSLADSYTMSDNYHQAVNGGTGANHVMLGTGDAIAFSDGAGHLAVPPNNPVNPASPKTPLPGYANSLSEIENPNPQPGTNNYYTEDGYGGGPGDPGDAKNYGGGSYVNCADPAQPGVAAVRDYLRALKPAINPRCQPGAYYLVNNYNPGYFGDGTNAYTDTNSNNYVFTIPPSTLPTIGDALNKNNISWAYFGDQFSVYLNDKYQTNPADAYCNICNWAQYSTSIMTSATQRAAHLQDTTALYTDIANNTLPAVSYVKPSGLVDGHPSSSKLDLFEGFVKKIVTGVQANPKLWAETAIFVTFDEGGGYYDSGYVQPLDFFGDGTRTPMIVVSPYSKGGRISHSYTDHVSTLKFIEANWGLEPISKRSRDNFPNPVTTAADPYVPTNSPAIGDMMDYFKF